VKYSHPKQKVTKTADLNNFCSSRYQHYCIQDTRQVLQQKWLWDCHICKLWHFIRRSKKTM